MVLFPVLARKEQKGQVLIEVLISLAVLILVVFGSLTAVTASVRNASFSRNKSLSIHYAKECLELIREKRNNDGLSSISSNDCSALSLPFNPTSPNPNVSITGGSSEKKVVVTVSWNETRGIVNTSLTTVLTNWRE